MRVLLAGAGGAIGVPLTRLLVEAGHDVVALTRSERSHERLRGLGARPVTTDVLAGEALLSALHGVRADAVVHQLTSLRKPPVSHRAMRQTNRLRTEGTRNLVRAAERVGATRFVTQSMLFGYGYGDAGGRVRTEDDEFAPRGAGRFEEHLAAMRLNEDLVLRSGAFDGIALRYGLFYGVGAGDTDLVASLRRRRLPVVREAGPLSWIYVEDAATATLAALVAGEGGEAYNVVDDEPVSWTTLMTELAAAIGAPRPPALPRWALPALPYAGVVLRGGVCATNLKARSKLRWAPAVPTYRDGIRRIAAAHR